jgi:hypothetical protein
MDILNALGVDIEATYVPHKTAAGESPTLRWIVSVRRNGRPFFETTYSAGYAHSPEYKSHGGRVTAAVIAECETGCVYGKHSTPVPPPAAADVVHSLIMDASTADEEFEDWASNYGYSTDSREAERIFNACGRTAAALRRAFTRDELTQLEAAFSDY